MTSELLKALELALPYVQKVSATAPTEYSRMVRQRQAVKDVETIRAAIEAAKQPAE